MVPFIPFHCDTSFGPIFFFTDEVLPYFLNAFIIVKTVLLKGELLCSFLQDVKQIYDIPRVCMWRFSSKYPADNFLKLVKIATF